MPLPNHTRAHTHTHARARAHTRSRTWHAIITADAARRLPTHPPPPAYHALVRAGVGAHGKVHLDCGAMFGCGSDSEPKQKPEELSETFTINFR